MLWDASQAYGMCYVNNPAYISANLASSEQLIANNQYDKGVKAALAAAGGTGFRFPACSAPAYVSGTAYQSGSRVSYGEYIWEVRQTFSTFNVVL